MKAPVKKAHPTKTIPLELKFGTWYTLFPELDRKLIVAEGLNSCVFHDGMVITGYLITDHTLYLLLEAESAHVNKLILLFSERIRKEIRHHLDIIPMRASSASGDEISATTKLFTTFPLFNSQLTYLITGRPVTIPYYDIHLERLKKQIHNYNFCSALDYSGAKGPVLIMRKNFETGICEHFNHL